ncbi:hypothetical protein ACN4EG_18175 [Alkalinema pantanalense CENA528]
MIAIEVTDWQVCDGVGENWLDWRMMDLREVGDGAIGGTVDDRGFGGVIK